MTAADEYYEAYPLPFTAYFRGDREKALSLCSEIESDDTLLSQFWSYAGLFTCGQEYRETAMAYFQELKDKGDYPPWIDLPLQLFLEEKKPEEVTRSKSHVHHAWAFQVTGNYLVNIGRDADAKAYFDEVIEADSFMMDVHQWAHAFQLRIEKDPGWFERMNPLGPRQ